MESMSVADHSDMKQELKRRTKQYRVMKDRNQELSDEMESIKSSLQAVQPPSAATLAQQARRSEVTFDALKLQIGDLNRRRKVLQHEVHTLTGSLAKERDRADTLQSRITVLEEEKTQDDSATLKKKALKIQKENKSLKDCTCRLEQQIMQLAGETPSRVDLLQQIAAQQEELSKRKTEIDVLKESCDNAAAEKLTKKDANGNNSAETTAEIAALRAGVKQYKKQIKTLIVEKSTTHKRIQDLECRVLESSGADLETRCNEQHVVIQELHRELQRNRETLSSLEADHSSRSKGHKVETRCDEHHLSFLTESLTTLEVQMAQMLNGLENIETNTSAILVDSEKILSYGVETRVKHNASAIAKASKKILKVLETMS